MAPAPEPTPHAPPRRPRRRVAVTAACLLVLGMFAAASFTLLWASSLKPNPTTDYGAMMEQLAGAAQPADASNRWDSVVRIHQLIEKAAGATTLPIPDMNRRDSTDSLRAAFDTATFGKPGPSTLERVATVRAALDMEEFDQSLRQLIFGKRFVRPIRLGGGMALVQTRFPEAGSLLVAANLNILRLREATQAGEADKVIHAFRANLAMARVLLLQPTLGDRVAGTVIAEHTLGELRTHLVDQAYDAATLGQLAADLDRQCVFTPASHTLEGERLGAMDSIQRIFSDNGAGGGRYLPTYAAKLGYVQGNAGAEGASSWDVVKALFLPGRRAVVADVDGYFEQGKPWADMDMQQRIITPFDPTREMTGLLERNPLAGSFLPPLEYVGMRELRLRLAVEGTRAMLGIERHQAAHGAYPQTLEEVVGPQGTLAALPVDPFSRGGLIYRRTRPSADVLGRAYLLYSTGRNMLDEDANEPKPIALEALTRPSGDYVLNAPYIPFPSMGGAHP